MADRPPSRRATPSLILRLAEHLAEMTVEDVLRFCMLLEADKEMRKSAPVVDEPTNVGASATLDALTSRERELFELLAGRCSHAQAAARLGISRNTEKSHAKAINHKLGCRSSTDLRRVAANHGLVRSLREDDAMGDVVLLPSNLATLTDRAFEAALRAAGRNHAKAAALLGVSRATVYNRTARLASENGNGLRRRPVRP